MQDPDRSLVERRPAIRNTLTNASAGGKHNHEARADRADGSEEAIERRHRIARIKHEIEQGTYETDAKLRIAIQRMLNHIDRES